MSCYAARPSKATVPITPVAQADYKGWLKKQSKRTAGWLKETGFEPDRRVGLVRAADGALERVVLVIGDDGPTWSAARLPEALPKGRYQLDDCDGELADAVALGWGLAAYSFDRYKDKPAPAVELVWPASCDRRRVEATVRAVHLGRDLITTPAGDLGPAELATAVRKLGGEHGARVSVITGKALLEKNYPAIYAVGQAAAKGREPRLIDLRWGPTKAPALTLVGKGVVFDSGGLDLKPPEYMRLMKKDMGGAASVISLASMIMATKLKVRLRVLIPAVENAVSGAAYRPGDVVATRKGLSVEIGNTDAEGRVILCDALAEAAAGKPDLIVDMATLTGAARVALGTEVPAFFCNDDGVAADIARAGDHASEPDLMWRLPLHRPYRRLLDSPIADLCNISSGRYGGAITAALFLREFVGDCRWVHVDTMGYNDNPQPGRPGGGEVLGVRGLYRMLAERY